MLELGAAVAIGVAVGHVTHAATRRWKAFRRSVLPDLVWSVARDPRGGRIWRFGRIPPKITRTASYRFVEVVRLPTGSLEGTSMPRLVTTQRETIHAGGLRFAHTGVAVAFGPFGLLKVDWFEVARSRGR